MTLAQKLRSLFTDFDIRFLAADVRALCQIPKHYRVGMVSPEMVSFINMGNEDEVIRIHADGTASHKSNGTIKLWDPPL